MENKKNEEVGIFDSLSEKEISEMAKFCEDNGVNAEDLKVADVSSISELAEKTNKKIAIHLNPFLEHYKDVKLYGDEVNEENFEALIDEMYEEKLLLTKDEFAQLVMIRHMLSSVWLYFYIRRNIYIQANLKENKDIETKKIEYCDIENNDFSKEEEMEYTKVTKLDKDLEENFEKIFFEFIANLTEEEIKDKVELYKTIIGLCKSRENIFATVTSYFTALNFKEMIKNDESDRIRTIYYFIVSDFLEFYSTIQKDSNNAKIFI